MQGATVINPQENSRTVDRQVLRAERVFLIVAVAITSIGFFVWGSSVARQFEAPWWLQYLVGGLAAFASAYVTDFAFRHFLEEVVYQGLAFFHPNATGRVEKDPYFKVLNVARWVLLTLVVIALFYADWNSVQTIRDPFAASARQRATTDIATVTATLSKNLSAASTPMAEQIAALKGDIKSAESRTQATNGGLAALASQGNGWAKNQLDQKKAAATRKSRRELEKLQSAYTKTLTEQSATLTNATAAINTENNQIALENDQKKRSLSDMFFMFGAGSKLLTVILRIFLVVSFLSKTPQLDANGDGIVDGKDVTAAARGDGDPSFR